MTAKKLTCDVCKKKQWGLSMLEFGNNIVGVCNDCYEVWDSINIKLEIPRLMVENAQRRSSVYVLKLQASYAAH